MGQFIRILEPVQRDRSRPSITQNEEEVFRMRYPKALRSRFRDEIRGRIYFDSSARKNRTDVGVASSRSRSQIVRSYEFRKDGHLANTAETERRRKEEEENRTSKFEIERIPGFRGDVGKSALVLQDILREYVSTRGESMLYRSVSFHRMRYIAGSRSDGMG